MDHDNIPADLAQDGAGVQRPVGSPALRHKLGRQLLGFVSKKKYYNNVNLLLGSPPGQVCPEQQQAEDLLVRHVRVSLAECAQLQRQHLLVRSQHL